MNETNKLSPCKIKENIKDHVNTNSIKTHLKLLIEEVPPQLKIESKLKENLPVQKNYQTCESPILKIAKKQKSKQIAEMLGESPDLKMEVKIGSINSMNSIDNESLSPEPKKLSHQTPQPTKSSHKVSKSTFLQHKYLENLVAKQPEITKPFSINLTNVANNVINEVDSYHEETPNNNLEFKFNKISQKKDKEDETLNKKKSKEFDLKANIKEKDELDKHPFRHLIFAPKTTENLFKKHLLITYKGVIYSQKLQNPSESFLQSRAIKLPENKDRPKTLFIDLDETLIHSCHLRENPEIVLNIGDKKIGFNVRPYCKEFLEKISKHYEVFLFTASTEAYAKAIINHIDPGKIIRGLFTDKVTMNTKNGFIIKDLRIFVNRNLKDLIIVDNLAHCFSYQIDNGVPLLEWQSDVNDKELKYLYGYLKKAVGYNDVRDYNKSMLKLRELGQLNIDELKL